MGDLRLFTGIAIDESVVSKLDAALRRVRALAPLNWTPLENLHITVKFIGAWPEARLDELTAALYALDAPAAFEVAVRGLGFFPNPRRARFFFAGIHAGRELTALYERTEAALSPLDIPPEERTYKPHLTLGRIRHENLGELKKQTQSMPEPDFGTFLATGFHLFRSVTSPKGSEYSSLASFPLRARAAGLHE